VFFTAAVLLSFRRDLTASAVCLGLAALAKGLVPLVLFAPVAVIAWRRIRIVPVLVFVVISVPWYVLCTLRNGSEFLQVFFMEHTFGRFSSLAMQHGQPWWFYFPALLLLLYPWFPLLAFARGSWDDTRLRTLVAVVVFGFVFFSAAANKLPGYLLPLLPAVCILTGFGLARMEVSRWTYIGPLALSGAMPGISQVVPSAIAHGLRAANIPWLELGAGMACGAALGVLVRERYAFPLVATGFIWLQIVIFPAIDRSASARPVWLESHPSCVSGLPGSMVYGLDYYAERRLPDCPVVR